MFDYRNCGFDDTDLALCQYALDLTLRPDKMKPGNIEQLRSHRLDEHQITIATQVISYFNYINRMADGLGVDPEPWMKLTHEQWLAKKHDWRN